MWYPLLLMWVTVTSKHLGRKGSLASQVRLGYWTPNACLERTVVGNEAWSCEATTKWATKVEEAIRVQIGDERFVKSREDQKLMTLELWVY